MVYIEIIPKSDYTEYGLISTSTHKVEASLGQGTL